MLHIEHLLMVLCKAEVAFIVIGGMAAVAQGSAYVTADLDICYQRHPRNYQRLSEALQPLHLRLRGAPADLPFVLDAATLRAGLNFTFTTDLGDLDLLGEVTGLGSYDTVKAQAEEIELYQYRVWVLTLAGLIRSKEAAGRPKDLRLLPELQALRALREELRENEPCILALWKPMSWACLTSAWRRLAQRSRLTRGVGAQDEHGNRTQQQTCRTNRRVPRRG